MRVAVMVISLLGMILLFFQSCAISVGGEMSADEDLSQGGAVGIVMAFLFVLGGAFVLGMPRASLVLFMIAGFLGLSAGATTSFSDLTIWGIVALVLAALSYFGWREKRGDQAKAEPATEVQEPRPDAG